MGPRGTPSTECARPSTRISASAGATTQSSPAASAMVTRRHGARLDVHLPGLAESDRLADQLDRVGPGRCQDPPPLGQSDGRTVLENLQLHRGENGQPPGPELPALASTASSARDAARSSAPIPVPSRTRIVWLPSARFSMRQRCRAVQHAVEMTSAPAGSVVTRIDPVPFTPAPAAAARRFRRHGRLTGSSRIVPSPACIGNEPRLRTARPPPRQSRPARPPDTTGGTTGLGTRSARSLARK